MSNDNELIRADSVYEAVMNDAMDKAVENMDAFADLARTLNRFASGKTDDRPLTTLIKDDVTFDLLIRAANAGCCTITARLLGRSVAGG